MSVIDAKCGKTRIITNNPKVRANSMFRRFDEFVDGDVEKVIRRCRDLVHTGWALVTHPMAGSLKPGENPFRTIIMRKTEDGLDFDSLAIIESAIHSANKFQKKWSGLLDANALDEKMLGIRDDFMTIDLSLITSGTDISIAQGES